MKQSIKLLIILLIFGLIFLLLIFSGETINEFASGMFHPQETVSGNFKDVTLNIRVKDDGSSVSGFYNLAHREDGYSLEITGVPEESLYFSPDKESRVNIHGIRDVPEGLLVAFDFPESDHINTNIVAVNEKLDFESAEVVLAKKGHVNVILKCEEFDFDQVTCLKWVQTHIPFTQDENFVYFDVVEFSGYGGGEIDILNVQSYPTLGGNWTVAFETIGTENLTISAWDNTTYTEIPDNSDTIQDLEFISLKCGDSLLEPDLVFNSDGTLKSVFVENYSCNNTGYHTVRVLTTGKHTQKFNFGNVTKYAFNLVNTIDYVYPTPGNDSYIPRDWIYVNVTLDNDTNTYGFTNFDQSLVGWWRLDNDSSVGENNSLVYDWSGLGINGTPQGNAAPTASGRFGGGFSFDGTGDFVDMGDPDNLEGVGGLTVSAWAKLATSTPQIIRHTIISQGASNQNTYDLFIEDQSPDRFRFSLYNDSGTGAVASSNGGEDYSQWHHVAGVYNGTNILMYVDGVLQTGPSSQMGSLTGVTESVETDPFRIGADRNGANLWNGSVDEVLLFNRSLSSDEIKALYDAQAPNFKGNVSGLSEGIHTFKSYAVDVAGSRVSSELRQTTVDVTSPTISYTSPTPDNASFLSQNYIYVNVSASDSNDIYGVTNFDNSLVSWYRLDNDVSAGENASHVYDWSGNGNNGTVQNDSAFTTAGRFGGGFSFDGDNDYIDVGDPSLLESLSELTVSVWVKSSVPNKTVTNPIVSQEGPGTDTFSLSWSSGENIVFSVWNGSYDQFSDQIIDGILDTKWHHVIGRLNGTHVEVFVDGVSSGSPTLFAGTTGTTTNSLTIGEAQNTPGWNGTIDEVLIFNRSLSTQEIQALYNAQAPNFTANFTSLADGVHTFQSHVIDQAGSSVSEELRQITLDGTAPVINFVSPTPGNGSVNNTNYIYVNISTSDLNDHYTFLDFDNSLVGWWRLDNDSSVGENTTHVYDWSGNGFNGSIGANATVNTTGKFDGSIWIDGTDESYVDLGNGNETENIDTLTVSLWVRFDYTSLPSSQFISKRRNNAADESWGITWSTTFNRVGFFIQNTTDDDVSSISSDNAISDHNWHHIVGVYNSTHILVFLDGSEVNYTSGISSMVGPIDDSDTNICIGQIGSVNICGTANAISNYNGSIDEVLIFNRSLSADEIASLYDAGVNKYSHNFTSLNEGSYTFKGYTVDEGGNRNETSLREVTISNPPVLVFNSPANNSGTTNDTMLLNWTISDVNDNNLEAWVYGSTNLSDLNNALLYHGSGLADGVYTYNWTSPVVSAADPDLVFLAHLDNRSGFGENATHVYDFTGNGNNGTVTNATPITSGKFGGAFDFDGNSGVIHLGEGDTLNENRSAISVSAWVKSSETSNPGHRGIYTQANVISFRWDSTEIFEFGVYNETGSSVFADAGSAITDLNWHHVVGVYNGSNVLLYLDNVLQSDQPSITGRTQIANNDVYIGAFSPGIQHYNGTIDEVAIWNRSLSAVEVQNLYRLGSGKYYWNVTVSDGTTDDSDISIFNIDNENPLIFNESITPPSVTELDNVLFRVTVSDFAIDTVILESNWSGSDVNYTMTDYIGNNTYRIYNYTVLAGNFSGGDTVRWRFYVNDTTGFTNSTVRAQFPVLPAIELFVQSTAYPSKIWANLTEFNVTVINGGDGPSSSINVTCYSDGDAFGSYIIATLLGNSTNSSLCLWNALKDNHTINVTVDPGNTIVEINDSNNTLSFNVTVARIFEINITANQSNVNTTEILQVSGTAQAQNGTSAEALSSAHVVVRLNGKIVTQDHLEDSQSEFQSGTLQYINLSAGTLRINLSSGNNGTFTSRAIDFGATSSYRYISWSSSEPSTTSVTLKTRTSADNSSWSAYSTLYTNSSGQQILSPGNRYIQFQAYLNTTNISVTPEVYSVTIGYQNITTDANGNYQWDFIVPTDDIGVLELRANATLEESVENTSTVDVWAQIRIDSTVLEDYSGSESNYTIQGNFTINDTNALVSGFVNITVSNATFSLSKTCSSTSVCERSYLVPSELVAGNYTVDIKGSNEPAYLRNGSSSFQYVFEERTTTGFLGVVNRSINDFQAGTDYSFLHNATLTNQGQASMNSVKVGFNSIATDVEIKSIVNLTSCGNIPIGGSCITTLNVTIDGSSNAGDIFVSWRSNWTNNDGSIGQALNTTMYITIVGNAFMNLTKTNLNGTVVHGGQFADNFDVEANGLGTIQNVNLTFIPDTMPFSWLSLSDNFFASIVSPGSETITITVNVPLHQSPGNYNGTIHVNTSNAENKTVTINITVPTNATWHFTPAVNLSLAVNFTLNQPGDIGTLFLNNTGNVDLNLTVSYSPWGITDYTAFGTQLFEENYNPGDGLRNPTSLYVSKGMVNNFSVYQKGRSASLNNVGIKIKMTNSTGVPTINETYADFYILEAAPNITNVLFLVSGQEASIVEQNTNVTIKSVIVDDVSINTSSIVYFISYSGGNSTISAASGPGNVTHRNFTANFTVSAAGLHNVTVNASDNAGNTVTSITYSFTSVGTTTQVLSNNQSLYTLSNITQSNNQSFAVTFIVNNTGQVTAYNTSLGFTLPSGWVAVPSPHSYGAIVTGGSDSQSFTITAPPGTQPGNYQATGSLSWDNPDSSSGNDVDSVTVVVSNNSLINITQSTVSLITGHSATGSDIITIVNEGNNNQTSVSVTCQSGTVCSVFTVNFNNTNFPLLTGESETINVTIGVPFGYLPGVYTGVINASGDASDTADIDVTVPTDQSYSTSPPNVSLSRGPENVGSFEIIINNTGNVITVFDITSSNVSMFTPNVSSISVPTASAASISVNYTTPQAPGNYPENVSITNTTYATPQINVTVNLTVVNFTVNIVTPTQASPTTNVTFGDSLLITAQAVYEGSNLTVNVTWTADINSSSCTSMSSAYTYVWELNCSAPNVTDGIAHDLEITGTYTVFNASSSDTEGSAIVYRDATPPTITFKNAIDVKVGGTANLTLNATDNSNVSSVIASITYPNGTIVNYTLPLTAGSANDGQYDLSLTNLTLQGDYDVIFFVNDSANNIAKDTEVFEVYSLVYFSGDIRDSNNNGVTVTFNLLRPGTSTIIHNFQVTGTFNQSVRNRIYDMNLTFFNADISIKNLSITNLTDPLDLDNVDADIFNFTIPLFRPLSGFSADTNITEAVSVTLDYSGESFSVENNLRIVKCGSWDFTGRDCSGSWEVLSTELNKSANIAMANSTSFSAYVVAEDTCGNGLCESFYEETESSCPVDCASQQIIVPGTGGSSGGGGSSSTTINQGSNLSAEDLAKIQEILKSAFSVGGVEIKTTSIFRELFPGEETTERIKLKNTLNANVVLKTTVNGSVSDFISFTEPLVTLLPGQERDFVIKIAVPLFTDSGSYDGDIIITSDNASILIPTTIRVVQPDTRLLDLKVQPLTDSILPGETLKVQVDLINLGKSQRVDVVFNLELIDQETEAVIATSEETFALETTLTTIKSINIPENTPLGRHLLRGSAKFPDSDIKVTSLAFVNVVKNFFDLTFLGITYAQYIVIGIIIGGNWFGYLYYRKRQERKKRYKIKVEYNTLPQPSERTGFIGKIAETGIRTFNDLDRMQTHTLIAGSTGSGKTVAAQDLVEEALKRKVAVIVFDPTAQWTGMLRRCTSKSMLKRYHYFDMKKGDAQGFKGVIKTIKNPREFIDLPRHMQPGEITIFNISKLDPKEIDIVVASTIQQVFKANLKESSKLNALIVYDEVHRLLPKFGGSGQGFVQLERGAREFRKWGIGLLLISQVLSDFIGEIKANIGTEVQMRTRYEGDLERLKLKYGEDLSASIVKAAVGTGMVVNSEYNRGRPYFVSFRPILHSVSRLENKELDEYEMYYGKIEDLTYQIEKLEENKVDTFDLKTELKLASTKLAQGAFNMVNIYMESLEPRVAKSWEKLGKKPPKRKVKTISEEEIKEAVEAAELERKELLEKEREVQEKEKKIKREEEKKILEKEKKKEGFTLEDLKGIYKEMESFLEEKKKEGMDVTSVDIKMKAIPADLKIAEASGSKDEVKALAKRMKSMIKELGMKDTLLDNIEDKTKKK